MSEPKSTDAESTLKQSGIHEEWVDNYRTPDNEHFYNMAFDYIADAFGSPKGATVVDAGCGSCAKSKNLADRGFHVIGTDLSEAALDLARQSLAGTPYENQIELQQQNLTSIDMPDNSVDYLVCWGVLMHIPDVEKAISEISRIMKPGGFVAISEANMHSLQTRIIRLLKKVLGRNRTEVHIVAAGIENWEETDEGRLMTRQANVPWMIREFSKHGIRIEKRVAGQFTEMYWMFSSPVIKKLIHFINWIWFKYIRLPGLSFANILIFRKEDH